MDYKVLIVDDSVENINILRGILNDKYKVMAAKNGETALKIAKKFLPNIILLDIEMPQMDGYEVCMRLKNDHLTEWIPVIFVSAKSKEIDEAKGFAVGAVDYVTKPVSPLIVSARVQTQIALRNQQIELEQKVREKTKELSETRREIIRRLGKAVEYKDQITGNHIERVSRYSHAIAISYGLSDNQADIILNAAPMHDIGKIGVDECIINKKGYLTDQEYDCMKQHCMIGFEILGDSKEGLIAAAKAIALQHHEKWDGTGYPHQLKGDEIDLFARIVAVADVFDALTTERSYKESWTNEKAIELIVSEKEKHFDPVIVDAFIAVFDEIHQIQKEFYDSTVTTT